MVNFIISGTTKICGVNVPKISGGFGENKKAMLAKNIAQLHEMELKHVNEAINNNRHRFKDGIDIIDIKEQVEMVDLFLAKGILSKAQIGNAKNVYLLSERGYAKLLKVFDDDLAWDKYEQIVDGYFQAEEQKQLIPSYMVEDKVSRALRWIEEEKEREALVQKVEEYSKRAVYVETILQSKGTVTTTQIGKDYGLSAQDLNKILHKEKVQYLVNKQWLLYQNHVNKGYTKSHTIDIVRSNGDPDYTMNTRWTQKGRLFIHEILTNLGYEANVDKDFKDVN